VVIAPWALEWFVEERKNRKKTVKVAPLQRPIRHSTILTWLSQCWVTFGFCGIFSRDALPLAWRRIFTSWSPSSTANDIFILIELTNADHTYRKVLSQAFQNNTLELLTRFI
jgi:hypothetical protein